MSLPTDTLLSHSQSSWPRYMIAQHGDLGYRWEIIHPDGTISPAEVWHTLTPVPYQVLAESMKLIVVRSD